jgi:hypothetical protein
MKGHASKRILINLLQDTLNGRKAMLVGQHIESCHTCSRNFQILKNITVPSPGKKTRPGRSVLKNIIAYYDGYHPRQKSEINRQVSFPRSRRIQLAAVGAACACILIFGVYSHMQYENAPIHASKVKGLVRADKNMLRKGERVRPGVLLTTGENSKLAIMYGKIMKLIAGPDTKISITKSHIDRKNGKIYFEMVIDKGTIIAVFDKGWKLEYTLITPHGKVSSSGSKIAMKVDSAMTRVMVKDGSANLSSTQGHSVNSEEGNGYSITNKEVTSALESSDKEADDSNNLYDNTKTDLQDDDDDDTTIQ